MFQSLIGNVQLFIALAILAISEVFVLFQSLIGNVQPDGMDVLTSGFMASFNPS